MTTAYVRKSGSDNNGGSSSGTSPERTGTDGVTNASTTFVAASGSFSAGDVGKLINIVTKGRYRIAGFTNSTTVTLSGSPSSGSGLTWNLGGAVLTIGALLANANAAITNGDVVYIGAGVYRETITVGISPTAEVIFAGDVDGSQTGDPGEVQWTAYTTNDKTAPAASAFLTLGGKDYLTFRNIVFVQGNNVGVSSNTQTSTNITFTNCCFITGYNGNPSNMINITCAYNVALNWVIDRCIFVKGNSACILITLVTGASPGTDYDASVLIRNCVFVGSSNASVQVGSSGTAVGEGGGVDVLNCTHLTGSSLLTTNGTRLSINIPCTVLNCFCLGGTTMLNAGEAGAITENFNIILGGSTPRTNVTAGANSISDGSYSPLISLGQEFFWGGKLRPLGMPAGPGSPLLGFGDSGAPSVDFLNRIRPAGGASASKAAGALEFHDSAVKETTTVRTGSNAIKIAGPGDQEFHIPVDAVSTTISVYGRFNSSYAGTKPQLKIVNSTECGVADDADIMTGSADTWEQLSLTFTPTSKGVVAVLLVSNTTDPAGSAYFDDFSVS